MEKSIFTKPLFINPQAYFVIPELYIISKCIPFEFGSDAYTFKINTDGIIDSKIINTNKETILHLDLILNTGNVVLGEWILDGDTDNLIINQLHNTITIDYAFVKPIASYRCYDKTNDDEDRDVLADLTGNGHDIQLYNFAFAESSGYGKYATDFSKWGGNYFDSKFSNKFTFTKTSGGSNFVIYLSNNPKINSFKIKASGFVLNNDYLIYRYYEEGVMKTYKIGNNGIHTLPASDGTNKIGFLSYNIQSEIIIEQIPDYQGALVSDGVDDYGLCENFPILDANKGFTICCIRTNFDVDKQKSFRFLSASKEPSIGGFIFEYNNGVSQNYNKLLNFSFGNPTGASEYINGFSYMTSVNYNGKIVSKGNISNKDNFLYLFGMSNGYFCNTALYALEIYDRDLTDEEIAKVKARMMAEYEAKTGNKYTEETT